MVGYGGMVEWALKPDLRYYVKYRAHINHPRAPIHQIIPHIIHPCGRRAFVSRSSKLGMNLCGLL